MCRPYAMFRARFSRAVFGGGGGARWELLAFPLGEVYSLHEVRGVVAHSRVLCVPLARAMARRG